MLNRLREYFTFRSFRHKLMFASIVCIVLPSVLSFSIYNYLTEGAVRKQAVYNSQESLKLVDGYVANLLKSMLNIANMIQMDSDMNSYFKQRVYGQAQKWDSYTRFTAEDRVRKQLVSLAYAGIWGRESRNSYVTVLLNDGTYFTSYPTDEYDPLDLTKEPWFTELQSLRGFQSHWISSTPTLFASEKKSNPYQISVVRTLRGDASDIYGIVIVTIMENQVNQMFERLVQKEEVMMVDGSNRIISHRDSSKIGQTVSFLNNHEPRAASEIIPIEHENYLVTELPTQFAGWKLVSMQPYESAIVDINSIFTKVFVFQLASFLMFLLLLIYLMRKFTIPLVRLGKVAATVQRGNLDVRSNIRGPDEIGRLGYSFDQMLDKVKEMILEVSATQARKRKAELAMLQAQISPHFLFNVLNSIRMKIMYRGDHESAEMVGSLSKLLRMTISQDKNDIPLHEEIELVTDYMKLMNMRQKEKAELQVAVAAEALLVKVPRFCLQPLIENAIIHGLNRRAGTIRVEADMGERVLQLSVKDSGTGMNAEELEALRLKIVTAQSDENEARKEHGGYFSGIGLANVYERMKMTFGEAFRMHIQSAEGEGTAIIMSIPREEA
ncbi:sensor histidine kinase [Paenibacillus chartarius]|uniref:histidine kinase n=1 Tax=Paenibacillus chartarius TaxID=747481 RepID=A0ABV6DRW5_9BACL